MLKAIHIHCRDPRIQNGVQFSLNNRYGPNNWIGLSFLGGAVMLSHQTSAYRHVTLEELAVCLGKFEIPDRLDVLLSSHDECKGCENERLKFCTETGRTEEEYFKMSLERAYQYVHTKIEGVCSRTLNRQLALNFELLHFPNNSLEAPRIFLLPTERKTWWRSLGNLFNGHDEGAQELAYAGIPS